MKSKRDANHVELTKAFEAMGCSVLDLHKVGGGCPDVLVGLHDFNHLIEFKNKDGRNTIEPSQTEFAEKWRGDGICIVRNDEDVERIVKWWWAVDG